MPRRNGSLAVQVLWTTVLTGTVLIPLVFSASGREAFRTPKLLLLRAEGIVLVAVLALAALFVPRLYEGVRWRSAHIALPLAIVGWTMFVTVVSPDGRLSTLSLVTVICTVAVFLATYIGARTGSDVALWALFAPALINAAMAVVQTKASWNAGMIRALIGEHSVDSLARVSPTGLLGNRDDLGGFLLPAAVLALALVLAPARERKTAEVLATVALIVGLIATNTLSAMIAFGVAALLMTFIRSWKVGACATAAFLVAVPIVITAYPALATRAKFLASSLRAGKYDQVLVGRVTPVLASTEMIRDHPLTGIGPGTFGKRYHEYKVAVSRKYEVVPRRGYIDYFREAHSDHLQTAAESGLPGYMLFVAAIAALASMTIRSQGSTEKSGLVRLVALPLAAAFAVLALTQFPLRLAATLQAFAFSSGMVAAWFDDGIR